MAVRTRWLLSTTVVLALGGLAVLLPVVAGTTEREVVVVARQMSFYVGDGNTPGPTIYMTPGERVRITLVNADPGFDHDFAVTAWGVRTPMLRGEGRTSIVVQAPREPGRATYVCSSHASMMSGVIEVTASPPSTAAGH